jgi:hypothetical protein
MTARLETNSHQKAGRITLRPAGVVTLVAPYINVAFGGSIARLACVDCSCAYQTGGQFAFAKDDLVWHHFLGTHVRQ